MLQLPTASTKLRKYFLPSLSPWNAVINKNGKHVEMIRSTKLIGRINIRGSMQIPTLMALRQLHKPPLPDRQESQHMNLLCDSLLELEKIFPSITYLITKDDDTVLITCAFDQLSPSQPNVSLILNQHCIFLGFRIEGGGALKEKKQKGNFVYLLCWCVLPPFSLFSEVFLIS